MWQVIPLSKQTLSKSCQLHDLDFIWKHGKRSIKNFLFAALNRNCDAASMINMHILQNSTLCVKVVTTTQGIKDI